MQILLQYCTSQNCKYLLCKYNLIDDYIVKDYFFSLLINLSHAAGTFLLSDIHPEIQKLICKNISRHSKMAQWPVSIAML